MAPAAWIVFAFVTALAVLALAAVFTGNGRSGLRQLAQDLRNGLRREPDAGGISLLRGTREDLAEYADVEGDGGVADLFRVGEVPESAYVDPSPVADQLVRVGRSLRSHVRP